jgi:hypothetical protein
VRKADTLLLPGRELSYQELRGPDACVLNCISLDQNCGIKEEMGASEDEIPHTLAFLIQFSWFFG